MHARAVPSIARLCLLSLLCLAGCSRGTTSSSAAPLPSGARLVPVPINDLAGLSGLARSPDGALFAVPERDRFLVELAPTGAEVHRYRVSGVPDEVEFESLAWLSNDHFAIGTEGGCKDGAEHVLFISREGDSAKVARDIKVPLSAWGASCDEKRGIEGLCATNGQILAAIEQPLSGKNGERLAAIARIDEASGESAAYRLLLTSKDGKISALDCRSKDGSIEVLAVERHFEVSRLLVFTIPEKGAAEEAPRSARVVLDLMPFSNQGKRNFEGVVWLDDKRAMLIVDNKYGKVTGPNEMVEVDLPNP